MNSDENMESTESKSRFHSTEVLRVQVGGRVRPLSVADEVCKRCLNTSHSGMDFPQ